MNIVLQEIGHLRLQTATILITEQEKRSYFADSVIYCNFKSASLPLPVATNIAEIPCKIKGFGFFVLRRCYVQ